jgi:hypothetical protein
VGLADERTITKAQLKQVGVDYDGPTLKWERRNRFSVSDVPLDDALLEVLNGEGHFVIDTNADDGSQREVSGADNPDAETNTIVDGNTGATSATKTAKARGTA